MTEQKAALAAWMQKNLTAEQRADLSGLVAKYVAGAVRADRQQQAEKRAAARSAVADVAKKVDDVLRRHGAPSMAGPSLADLFRGAGFR